MTRVQLKRLKELEKENQRLRRAVSINPSEAHLLKGERAHRIYFEA
jgi:hypothetical protein